MDARLSPPPPSWGPYEDAEAHLRAWLGLVGCRLRRYVALYGHRMLQGDGRLSDLHVSLREALSLLREQHPALAPTSLRDVGGWPSAEQAEQELEARARELEARVEAGLLQDQALPLEAMRGALRLEVHHLWLLVAAAAPSLSVDLARLYTFAWADFGRKEPTVGFLAELVGEPRELWALAEELGPGGALARAGLLELGPAEERGRRLTPLERAVRVPDEVLRRLQGRPVGLPWGCARDEGEQPKDALVLEDEARQALEQGLGRFFRGRDRRLRLILAGPKGAGRRSALAAQAREAGYGLLVVELDAGAVEAQRLRHAAREALLERRILLLRAEPLEQEPEAWGPRGPLWELLDEHPGLVAVSVGQVPAPLARLGERAVIVPFPNASKPRQLQAWTQALRASKHPLAEPLARQLSATLDAEPGTIYGAVARARRRCVEQGRAAGSWGAAELHEAFGQGRAHGLGAIAEPFSVGLGWEDLVLPPETREVLQEILAHGRHREQVFDEWGFRDKLPYGRGLSCLFSGPPGTGKTLTAGILARMWGRPLFRIDLSRITSKWVGETEKNLASLFREAERAQVILLFDEADSIFSSRTEVKSSNDKYANLEVNYLLQRMENYDGVTLLTTNFEQSIDEAFKRRIRFKVYFPFPDEQARALLWRSSFPKKVPLEADIDWEALAAQHEMSGGNIKNASLRAAFYAVQESARVSMEHLERAAMAEAREMGRLIRA
jgi:hypothetical protein